MLTAHQVAVVEVIFEADAGSQKAHSRDDKPLLLSVEQLQHLLHHIVPQHIVPAHIMESSLHRASEGQYYSTHFLQHMDSLAGAVSTTQKLSFLCMQIRVIDPRQHLRPS